MNKHIVSVNITVTDAPDAQTVIRLIDNILYEVVGGNGHHDEPFVDTWTEPVVICAHDGHTDNSDCPDT